ncbi:hypothetical protein CROQUDRAFT_245692 [Cronartium quercuum f. sp. fusiforme G11]|uniref:Uncharacterized protein n=1 Tax=Cronartium quercuum f. sp. fusiforme G11 TaxID=708437 RepID=A0A9P6NV58_9BASI|nr:hypothetical protein CROQUDRAFT_245692 [Cronartium quercuum f. sp. fusiforme G11]
MVNYHPHSVPIKSQPAIRLLASPAHLLFQLIKLTTLPYLIAQLIQPPSATTTTTTSQSVQPQTSEPRSESRLKSKLKPKTPFQQTSFNHQPSAPFSTHSCTIVTMASPPQPSSRRITTSRLHNLLRSHVEPDQAELTNLLRSLDRPKSRTVSLALLRARPSLLAARLEPPPKPAPFAIARAWQAEAVSQIVNGWTIPCPPIPATDEARARYLRHLSRARRNAREAFLANGPTTCACTRPPPRFLPASPDDPLFVTFLSLQPRLSPLARARLIDICLARRRWDVAAQLIFKSSEGPKEPKLKSRLLRQTTGLLLHLRSTTEHLSYSPELQRAVLSLLESSRNKLNKLSLDVVCRFAAQPIINNHTRLASRTRRRARTFLRSLLDNQALPRWAILRLLDHSAQHGPARSFTTILNRALASDKVCPKLARAILKASARGMCTLETQTIRELAGKLSVDDLRSAIDTLPEEEAVELATRAGDERSIAHLIARFPHHASLGTAHRLAYMPSKIVGAYEDEKVVQAWVRTKRVKAETEARRLWHRLEPQERLWKIVAEAGGGREWSTLPGSRELAKASRVDTRFERQIERRRLDGRIRIKDVKRVWARRVATETVWWSTR